MHFRKKLFLITLSIFSLSSCEKDDICDGVTATPNAIIEFYDRANSTALKPFYKLRCFVTPETGNQIKYIEYRNTSKIEIPLNINENQTIWNLELTEIVNNDTLIQVDQVYFNYQPKTEYVSKACGYKSIFIDISTSLNNNGNGNWITNFTPLSNQIINEEQPYAKIYY